MDSALSSATSPTLLGRLRQDPLDGAAWSTFVVRYGPRIHAWCRQWRLQEADAQDVTQDVLIKLLARMRTFTYDASGSFRAWLKTIAHRAWMKYVDALRRPGGGTGDSAVNTLLDSVEARDDLARRLDKEFDLELLEGAMAVVRERVEPGTWEAFRRLALEHESGEDVAAALGKSVDTVFKARSNVTKLLREEMKKMEG